MNMHLQGGVASGVQRPNAGVDVSKQHLDVCLHSSSGRLGNDAQGWSELVAMLKAAGASRIKGLFLVAAPEGLRALEAVHPDVEVYTASIDERLNEKGYILPGLGDAGDKIFGTRVD